MFKTRLPKRQQGFRKSLISVVFAGLVLVTSQVAWSEVRFAKGSFSFAELQNQQTWWQGLALQDQSSQDWVVGYRGAIGQRESKQLESLGIRVLRFIPDSAWIVSATNEQMQSLQANAPANLEGAARLPAWLKLSEDLPSMSVFSEGNRIRSLVTVYQPETLLLVQEQLESMGAEVIFAQDRSLVVVASLGTLARVAGLGAVEFVQELVPMQTMDFNPALSDGNPAEVNPFTGDYSDLTGFEDGTRILGVEALRGWNGKGQVVGMADTGLDIGKIDGISADFQGAIQGNGHSFGVGANDWSDPMGHGTHVAGSVLSRGVISGGKIRGAAVGAKLVPQGMWSPILDNLTVPPQLARMFQAAYNDGARLHTNSWGSPANLGAYDSMAQQVDDFMWKNPEMLILFAAGNSGVDKDKDGVIDSGSISTPGTAKNALTVGASKNLVLVGGIQRKIGELRAAKDNWPAEPIFSSKLSETSAGIAMFSSRGPTRDGRIKPEVVAPGTNILSNKSNQPGAQDLWGVYNSQYVFSGGTSMATPLTAGAAAVARQMLMERFGQAQPSAALVKVALMQTAWNMYPGQFGLGSKQEIQSRPDGNQGYGRVDLSALEQLTAAVWVDEKSGVGTNEVFEREISVPAGGAVRITLTYTDAPGSPTAARALVNNLDLELISPSGQKTESSDAINNTHSLELSQLAEGTYKVRVRGKNVPMGQNGKQPFALAIAVQAGK